MDFIKDCQTYRTEVNGYSAIFTVNLNHSDYHNHGYDTIIQFSLHYNGDEYGMPEEEDYELVISRTLDVVSYLSEQTGVFFAGQFISNSAVKMTFYCQNLDSFLPAYREFDFLSEEDLSIQHDPDWDVYFDFLLASPLELKINATEEIINLLESSGRNLSDIYLIEHTFHFDQEEKMFPFMEEVSLGHHSFNSLKYSSDAIKPEDDEPYYMVKIEQELALDTSEIFQQVERFEQIANQFGGDYIGWGSGDSVEDKKQLN